jgi:hypothetical protein
MLLLSATDLVVASQKKFLIYCYYPILELMVVVATLTLFTNLKN